VLDVIERKDGLFGLRISGGKISVDHWDGQRHRAQESNDDSLSEMHFSDGLVLNQRNECGNSYGEIREGQDDTLSWRWLSLKYSRERSAYDRPTCLCLIVIVDINQSDLPGSWFKLSCDSSDMFFASYLRHTFPVMIVADVRFCNVRISLD
jgi:hypothetical protein